MNLETLSVSVEHLIELGEAVKSTARESKDMRWVVVDSESFYAFRSSSLSFLGRVFGENHVYYREFDEVASSPKLTPVLRGLGVLKGVKIEVASGWLTSARSLAASEVLADFIDMADHLLDAGYKDPAAVVLGSVLERHLRALCDANGIDTEIEKGGKKTPKKADLLNAELAKQTVYNKIDQKGVTAWLGIRNSAAHGHYDEYTHEGVQAMQASIVEFLGRNPA